MSPKFKIGELVICVTSKIKCGITYPGGSGWKEHFEFKITKITNTSSCGYPIYWCGAHKSGVYEPWLKLNKFWRE